MTLQNQRYERRENDLYGGVGKMNTVGWVTMGVLNVLLIVPAIFLLNGKGSFLIAGYNTMSPEMKAKYDKIKLCKLTGWLLIATGIILDIAVIAFIFEMMLLGNLLIVLLFASIFGVVIYANTGKRFEKKPNEEAKEE